MPATGQQNTGAGRRRLLSGGIEIRSLTPIACEGREIDVELGFAQACAVGQISRGIRYPLYPSLRRHKAAKDVLEPGLGHVWVIEKLAEELHYQAVVPSPGVPV